MHTNPLLARRAIPTRERLQKALSCLVLTILGVALTWVLTDGSLDANPVYLFAIGFAALLGLSVSAYFWFKKEETAHSKEDGRFVRRRIEDDRQGRSWISRIGYNTRKFLSGIIAFVGVLFVLAGLGVLGLQVYGYLKTGDWGSISLLGVATPYWRWLHSPQGWFGLHKIVTDAMGLMPLSMALVLVGWLIAGFGSALRQRISLKGRS